MSKNEETEKPILKIPNYSIKTIFWEYLENIILDRNPKMLYDPEIITVGLDTLAFKDDYQPFFESFQKNFLTNLSNRDLENFSEKNVKLLLLSILFQTNIYLPISEMENSEGYSDIYLQARRYLYPKIINDWVWELKYVKEADAKKTRIIATKKKETLEQLNRYKTSNLFKDRTDVRYLAVVFIGKKKYWIEEVTLSNEQ